MNTEKIKYMNGGFINNVAEYLIAQKELI